MTTVDHFSICCDYYRCSRSCVSLSCRRTVLRAYSLTTSCRRVDDQTGTEQVSAASSGDVARIRSSAHQASASFPALPRQGLCGILSRQAATHPGRPVVLLCYICVGVHNLRRPRLTGRAEVSVPSHPSCVGRGGCRLLGATSAVSLTKRGSHSLGSCLGERPRSADPCSVLYKRILQVRGRCRGRWTQHPPPPLPSDTNLLPCGAVLRQRGRVVIPHAAGAARAGGARGRPVPVARRCPQPRSGDPPFVATQVLIQTPISDCMLCSSRPQLRQKALTALRPQAEEEDACNMPAEEMLC